MQVGSSFPTDVRQRLRDALEAGEDPVEQYRLALEVGIDLLDVENAHLKQVPAPETADSRIGENGTAGGARISVSAGNTDWIETGDTVDHPGYCEIVLESNEQLAIADAKTEGYADNPGYADYGASCYLGTPIEVDGEQYGTVCFVSREPRETEFDPSERLFAHLFVEIIGNHITRNETKRALETSREKYASLAEATPGAVFLCDAATGSILDVNDAAVELTGYERDSLTELGYEQLFPQAQTDDAPIVERLLDTDSTVDTFPDDTVLRLRTADGSRRPVEGSAEWLSADQSVFQLHVRNLESERRRERRAEAIFDQTHQFTGLLSPDGTLLEANDTAVSSLAASHEELVGKPFWECEWWTDETRPELRDAISRAADGEFVRYETTVHTRGGDLPIDFSIRPVFNDDDEVEWLIPEGRDISDRVEREQQLNVLGRLLRHNFRNRMTVVQGRVEQITEAPAETDGAASVVTAELQNLKELVSQYYATVDLLREKPTPRPVPIGSLVRAAASDVDRAHEGATISVTGSDSARVIGVPAVEDAVRELIENAVVHNDSAEPSVTVSINRRSDRTTVRIVDDGPGLPEQDARILRGTQSIDPVEHGTGIDLWRVYWTLELARAEITVDTSGDGTVIEMRFETADS